MLRSQVFSGDALSHAAFTGALGALAVGVDLRLGLFVVAVAVAVGMGLLGTRGRADDVVIGTVFTWVLGLGVLFLSLYTTGSPSAGNGAASVNVLFGSILGLSAGQARLAAIVGVGACLVVVLVGAPVAVREHRRGRRRGAWRAGAGARHRFPRARRRLRGRGDARRSARCCSSAWSRRPRVRRNG